MDLPFSIPTYQDRLAKVRSAMAAAELDGLVVTLPDSVNWLSGFSSVGYLWPQALVIDSSNDDPTLVTRTTEGPGALVSSWLRQPRLYDIAVDDPVDVLTATLAELGLGHARIGIEMSAFTLVPANLGKLKDRMPGVTWIDASDLVPEERLVKSDAEISYQRQAAEIADYAMERVFDAIRPGISEVELAGLASQALGEAGSEYAAIPPMVVSGERSALVHALATRKTISRGDLVCIEFAGVVHRYHAVLMRTVSVGPPSDRVAEVAGSLERATEAAILASAPGARAQDPDDACNAVLAERDLVGHRCHRVGYSLGIAYPPGWLEPMTLVEGDDHILAPNMSFTIEPNLHLPHEAFGMKMGDTVHCATGDARSMSRLGHGLHVLN